MPLSAGARLGPYEIISPLGAGGMGEVYRARDTKLGRSVAIKVLPEAVATHPDRIARFEREAKVLASLNHPHIAALFGMEESAGRHFLVMELVEGETLAERIASPTCIRTRPPCRRRAEDRAPDCGGARSRARVRNHPSRSEAGQHQGHARRGREGPGLRSREGIGGRPIRPGPLAVADRQLRRHARRHHPRDRCVHESGAGARQTSRQAYRHLGVRVCPVRDVDWPARVFGRDGVRCGGGDPEPRARLARVACGNAGERPAAAAPIPRERSKAPGSRHRRRTNRARRDARSAIRVRSSHVTGSVRAHRHERCARQGACPAGLDRRNSVGGRDRRGAGSRARRLVRPAGSGHPRLSFLDRSPRGNANPGGPRLGESRPGGTLCLVARRTPPRVRGETGCTPDYPCSGCVRSMRLSHRAWLGPRVPRTRSGRPTLASSPSWRRAS